MPSKGLKPFILLTLLFAACSAGSQDAAVSRELQSFFEEFVGRDLSGDEIRDVTAEFVAIHAAGGKSPEAIRSIARELGANADANLYGSPVPAAIGARHALLERSYLDPDLHGTLQLRLLNESDPVRVVDARSRRVMTERDVVALANLRRFASSKGEPRHTPLSRDQVDQLVLALQAAAGGNSGNMPRFFAEAAAFWAGVQREWPKLDSQGQAMVRSYAEKTWRVQMPVEMYGRLWGLDAPQASRRHADDVSARISAITDINMRLGNLPFVMDAIFGR